jgi:hypothetical protein
MTPDRPDSDARITDPGSFSWERSDRCLTPESPLVASV